MKKLTIIIIALLANITLFAQNLYIKGGAAYSLQIPAANVGARTSEATATTTSFESVKSNLASGYHPQITIGYYLNKYAAFEISTGYHFGAKQSIENQQQKNYWATNCQFTPQSHIIFLKVHRFI